MTIVKSASELQRNIGSIYELCHETREPVYITRNGQADLVVMDARSFDERMDLQQRVFDREMRLRQAVEDGRRQIEMGECRRWNDVKRELGL